MISQYRGGGGQLPLPAPSMSTALLSGLLLQQEVYLILWFIGLVLKEFLKWFYFSKTKEFLILIHLICNYPKVAKTPKFQVRKSYSSRHLHTGTLKCSELFFTLAK